MKFNSKIQEIRWRQGLCCRCGIKQLVTKRFCRECADIKNEMTQRHRSKDPEHTKLISRAQDAKRKSQKHEYYRQNRERIIERGKIWKERNPEKVKAIMNTPKRKEYERNYRIKFRARIIAYLREWYRQNRPVQYEPVTEFYPYVFDLEKEGSDLIAEINSLVPKQIDDSVRADICQELALLVFSGEIPRDQISRALKSVIKEQKKFMPSKWVISLDSLEDWQRDKLEVKPIA